MFTQDHINKLASIILIGKENAMTAKQIAIRMGFNSSGTQQDTRKLIRQANNQGIFILSSSKGFWISNNEQEVEEYVDSLWLRSAQISQRAKNITTWWLNSHPEEAK